MKLNVFGVKVTDFVQFFLKTYFVVAMLLCFENEKDDLNVSNRTIKWIKQCE